MLRATRKKIIIVFISSITQIPVKGLKIIITCHDANAPRIKITNQL